MGLQEMFASVKPERPSLGPRRAVYYDIAKVAQDVPAFLNQEEESLFSSIDLIYRTLCGILFNFVPTSGHPGGSISSGRIVESLIYNSMDYNFSDPDASKADLLSYAAGHKAMGLYAMWALRNELVRASHPDLLPGIEKQLRLEDMLGFRRNPTQETPLFKEFQAKALDGHPTPLVPFVRIATGPSGVGVPASVGLAFGAMDIFRSDPPKIHILEGEGGMTPGRVHEALAAAASAQLSNAIMHLDWNQASIDSNRVCRDGETPGEYVQWTPAELALTHDWNVVYVPNGFDFQQIQLAQKLAHSLDNGQPTMIVYKTVKGWKYGIEGKASHGAGHKFCSEAYYDYLRPFEEEFNVRFPRFSGEATPDRVEAAFWDTLLVIRSVIESHKEIAEFAGERIVAAKERLAKRQRTPRKDLPQLERLYDKQAGPKPEDSAKYFSFAPGDAVTLRATLGKALNVVNKLTGGAVIGAAADLLNSTSVSGLAQDFPAGLYNAKSNPDARLIAVGGICEDAMGAFMAGLAAYGYHLSVTSSYAAFISAMEHTAARVHGIGQQARASVDGKPYKTWIIVNAHAGVKTGEDGPTHADPQALQVLQENFPRDVLITLTPWDPQEIWPLFIAALRARPAVLAPFVTRPAETIVDRQKLGLPPVEAATKGIYAFRKADPAKKAYHGTVVLHGNGVASEFVHHVLPGLDKAGINMNVFYVTSVEMFNLLPEAEQRAIFPPELAQEAMGITDFTLPTIYRWIRSEEGIRRTLYPFREGKYLGSGKANKVLEEAGINGPAQLEAVLDYAHAMER